MKTIEQLKFIKSNNKMFLYLQIVFIALLSSVAVFAGTTGKISGYITDQETGEPIVGANIIIEGTYLGASCDLDGYFAINNIPPGEYRVIISAVGYQKIIVEKVLVKIDLTTKLDMKLTSSVIQLDQEVVVTSQRPLVQKDLTSTSVTISSEEIKMLPVESIGQIVNLQAGVIDGHFRGGRSNDVAYLVDGVAVTDAFNGGFGVQVENSSIRQMEVISGTFNAEYGQALSGVVNIVTQSGSDKFEGYVTGYIGNYFTSHTNIFQNLDDASRIAQKNVQVTFSGPISPVKNLYFFLTGRYYQNEGHLYGRRVYNTTDDVPFQPDPNDNTFWIPRNTGDGEYVSMNPELKYSFNGKLTYALPELSITYSMFWDDNENRYYDHGFSWTPDAVMTHYRDNMIHNLQLTHYPSQNTYQTLKFSANYFNYEGYLYPDAPVDPFTNPYGIDPRYVNPDQGVSSSPYTFRQGGNQTGRYSRYTNTFIAQWALTSQISKEHKIGVGIEGRYYDMYSMNKDIVNLTDGQLDTLGNEIFTPGYPNKGAITDQGSYIEYARNPLEISAYVQDKMEYDIMIINAGVRFDYFNSNASLPVDLRNPRRNPDFPGSIEDPNNPGTYLLEMRKADAKFQVSPRLGASFPITDQGIIRFSYGHFFKIPSFENLYSNPDFYVSPGNSLQSVTGNPDLNAEKNVIYEIGLQQVLFENFALNFSVYYRDIRNWLGMEIINTYEGFKYARFINRDYANVKGFILSLDKRFADYFSAKIDYTFQIAQGNASDPYAVYNNNQTNPPIEETKSVVPLNWDQRHTLNASVNVGVPGDWTLGFIFQYGSGQPYTEDTRVSQGVRFENGGVKPIFYNVDLRAEKTFDVYGFSINTYLMIYNLFDIKNEFGVYSTTGRSNVDLNTQYVKQSDIIGLNTIEQYVNNPSMYSTPEKFVWDWDLGFRDLIGEHNVKKVLFIIIALVVSDLALAQVSDQIQKYRDDAKGDIQNRREGTMDGNQVRTLFYNNGEVGQWPYQPSGEWPKGTGQSYLDGVAVLIATEMTAPGNQQVVHPLQTSYREWMDKDPSTGLIWGLEPVPGYIDPQSEKPAINTDPTSWPETWPNALDLTPEWDGFWYGYFGRGVNNSDFETFFVMDDSKDKEWSRVPFNYYPLSSDLDRGGLGLRVEVRGFQWSQVLAEDIIFWHYDIVNLAEYDYPTTIFGFYTDCGVGGTDDSEDDNASFDVLIDLAYCYDDDGLGVPNNWQTGYYGYAYLESPGNGGNGIDDDNDGIIDERRDDGIDNDNDWVIYTDLNSNGQWDPEENEPLNDDVGKDGVGPFDRQYIGPDEGEGDGLKTSGEPNFDKTDKDESDQIGLTSVAIYRLGQGGTGGGWPKDDEAMWLKMSYANFDTSLQRANISMVFASGPFPLNQGLRERFSMALVFGENLEDITFNKETVQLIYNANYNFSKPPLKPELTAVPGDQQVFLYWDNIAEESRDAFLGYQNNDPTQGYKKDFEGYMIYRSTEPEFNDIKIITDSKGSPKYWKPIAQYDLIDSMEINGVKVPISGPDPVGINGAHFWRGNNSGLRYSYVDNDVQNGQTYYYACVSYDMGDPTFGTTGLQPSECTKIISVDFAGTLKFVDINCAVVVPNAPVAGYIPPQILGDTKSVTSGVGTGSLNVNILDPAQILNGAQYNIDFKSTDDYPLYKTVSLNVIRNFAGVTDTIVRNIDSSYIGANRVSQPFDGMALTIVNDTTISVVDSLTGWVVGTSNLSIFVTPDPTAVRGIPWPADYEIQFSDTPQDTCFINSPPLYRKFPVNLKVWNKTEGKYSKIAVKDNDGSQTLTIGDQIQILEFQGAVNNTNLRYAWNLSYDPPFNPNITPVEPVAGDKFQISTNKPFKTGDYFSYSTVPVMIDKSKAGTELTKIDVVPNPYLGAASWESRNLNSTGRGERKIDFVNLPAQCTIRIYTITGALVKTLSKDSGFLDGSLSWNLVTEDGMDAAYGVYLYHVDAPGIGEHIGKFALIK